MKGAAALHCLRYFLGFDRAQTQTTPAERLLLTQYARGRSSLLEIGVFQGVTTRLIAEAMPSGSELYAVDPFFKGSFGICWSKPIARREVSRAKGKRVHFIELLSHEAYAVLNRQFDFIFIDADHSLEGIEQDWKLWSQRCIQGGVIALHDTRETPAAPQVSELGSCKYYNNVIRYVPEFDEIAFVDSLSIVKRRAA